MARSTLRIGLVNLVKKNGLNVNSLLLILHKKIVLVREETHYHGYGKIYVARKEFSKDVLARGSK